MPNKRAAPSPKRDPCRLEELIGSQLTDGGRAAQWVSHRRRSGRTSSLPEGGKPWWADVYKT